MPDIHKNMFDCTQLSFTQNIFLFKDEAEL